MVLAFKKKFVPKIKDGTKIHTIREDSKKRWRAGMDIHLATGVRTKNYDCFKESKCVSVQKIVIEKLDDQKEWFRNFVIIVDRVYLTRSEIIELTKNDGFDSPEEFFEWFDKDFTGRIIHWTKKSY